MHAFSKPSLLTSNSFLDRVPVRKPDLETPATPATGHAVTWEGWSFRWSISRIEGLVPTDLKFRARQVVKYAGLCELQPLYAHGYRTRDRSLKVGFESRMEELVVGKNRCPASSRANSSS